MNKSYAHRNRVRKQKEKPRIMKRKSIASHCYLYIYHYIQRRVRVRAEDGVFGGYTGRRAGNDTYNRNKGERTPGLVARSLNSRRAE